MIAIDLLATLVAFLGGGSSLLSMDVKELYLYICVQSSDTGVHLYDDSV